MKIESLLRRKGGTKVTLDGIEYHFKPDAEGREFADVPNEKHIGIFVSIPEGYRKAGDAQKVAAAPVTEPAPAPLAPAEPATPAAPNNADLPPNLDTLDRPALANLYEEHFGHRPAPRLSPAKILQALYDGKAA